MESGDEEIDDVDRMRGNGRDSGMFGHSEKCGVIWHNRRQRRSYGDMGDNETSVEQGLSAGEVMRRLTAEDTASPATAADWRIKCRSSRTKASM